MVTAKKDVFLKTSVLHLLKVEQNVLSDGLNCVLLARSIITELCKEDFTKSSFSKQCFFLEIFKLAISVLLISITNHDRLALYH